MKKSQRTVKFTPAEKEALKLFFEQLEEDMSNSGCNDMYLRNTDDNRQMVQETIRHCFKKIDQADMLENLEEQTGKQIVAMDSHVWSYLRWKLEKMIK